MGYNIYIGNAKIEYSKERAEISLGIDICIHNLAPIDGFTQQSNAMHPSYSYWHDFCIATKIKPLFFGSGWDTVIGGYDSCPEDFHREEPLFQEHPGIMPLKDEDYAYINAKRIKYECLDEHSVEYLQILKWLEFWFKWALHNCEYPCISNS